MIVKPESSKAELSFYGIAPTKQSADVARMCRCLGRGGTIASEREGRFFTHFQASVLLFSFLNSPGGERLSSKGKSNFFEKHISTKE